MDNAALDDVTEMVNELEDHILGNYKDEQIKSDVDVLSQSLNSNKERKATLVTVNGTKFVDGVPYHAMRYRQLKASGKYSCSVCGKNFSGKYSLEIHIRYSHTKEKPFSCDICGKSFGMKARVGQHIAMVHEKIRPYSCKPCNRDFSCLSNYRKHLATGSHQQKQLMFLQQKFEDTSISTPKNSTKCSESNIILRYQTENKRLIQENQALKQELQFLKSELDKHNHNHQNIAQSNKYYTNPEGDNSTPQQLMYCNVVNLPEGTPIESIFDQIQFQTHQISRPTMMGVPSQYSSSSLTFHPANIQQFIQKMQRISFYII